MMEETFFHLFYLAVVNAHILHNKSSKEKISLEIFYEKVAKWLLASAGTEIQALGQTSSPADRLVETDHFLYGIPATHAKAEGKTQRSCRKRHAPDQENSDEIHYNVLQKIWHWILYRAVFWNLTLKTELLGMKVTITIFFDR
jgi:hypothetical protein